MATTYVLLIERHTARLRETSTSTSKEQIVRNHLTALRAFLRSHNLSETAPVGTEMTTDFADAVERHVAASGLGGRSRSDRFGLLRAWKTTFEYMQKGPESKSIGRQRRSAEAAVADMTPFERGLRAALKSQGLCPKRAAHLAGISPSALGRWTRGALPNQRSTQNLPRLENVLKLEPGTLSTLLHESLTEDGPTHVSAYRQRQSAAPKISYSLKREEVSQDLLNEWRSLLAYKTDVVPSGELKRRAGAEWTLVEADQAARAPTEFNSLDGLVADTADGDWKRVARFLGFLRLEQHGGYGRPVDDVQTLAWLAVPEAVTAFLNFMTKRSCGLKHMGHAVFCSLVASLTSAEYGYLAQSQELLAKLPADIVKGRSWSTLCLKAYAIARTWKSKSKDVSRSPADALQFFLNQSFPLAPVFAAMKKLRRQGDLAARGSTEEAVARRDEVLLGLLSSNPLRSKNIGNLTLQALKSGGNIYKTATGDWRLRILGKHMKNRKRVRAQIYDVPIAKWLTGRLDDYVTHFRPVLVGEGQDCGLLFVTRAGARLNVSARVYSLTKTLIPQSGGIYTHAFRHLVATDWLTRNPNDFLTVSELLNDTIAVVMKNYAHLKKDVAFVRYEVYLEKMIAAQNL
ncbi:hypothetical protein GCM10028813_11250 [Ramlibacter alkalitolerans]